MVFPAPQGLGPAMYSMRKYAGPSDPKDPKEEERKRKERRKENITIALFYVGACVGFCAFMLWSYRDIETVTTSDKVIFCVCVAFICAALGFFTWLFAEMIRCFD